MGLKDTVTTKYMGQNEIFADIFNYFIYEEEQVIAPDSLEELEFEEQDARVLELVPDYKINLIAPASMGDDDFDKFRTSLKEVLSFIKYSQDAGRLEEVLKADEGFRHLGRAEVDVLNACVGAKLTMEKGEEAIDSVPNKRKACLFGNRGNESESSKECGREGEDFYFIEKHRKPYGKSRVVSRAFYGCAGCF